MNTTQNYKQINKIIILLNILITITSFSQRINYSDLILKNYNISELKEIALKFQQRYTSDKKQALYLAKLNDWPVNINSNNSIAELIRVQNGFPIYYATKNIDAMISTRTNALHFNGSLGLNIEGQNMTAYVWDGGVARITHQEFNNNGISRYSIGDSSNTTDNHSTHVTGTIISSGIDLDSKGMAPKASAIGFDWNNDLSEITTETISGMLVSNHSYGLIASTVPDYFFGAYVQESQSIDQIMYNAPYYLAIIAAGNDGQDNSSNGTPLESNPTYDKLTGLSCAKNTLVVANANDANIDLNENLVSVSINPSSSQGPTDDLRIKPDITGNGTGVYSTWGDSDISYQSISGTSMATPNVTGSLLLLQQLYFVQNNNFMKASSLKGLVLHTADDAGQIGPDALFGWGLLNTKAAAELILNNGESTMIYESTLSSGDFYTTSVTSDGTNKLVVSLSWTDPSGNINIGNVNDQSPVLINDLDLRVEQNGVVFYPYRLTSVNSNDNGDNIVDPYEKIIIDVPDGTYTIRVTHKGTELFSGIQNFSLIVSGLAYTGTCIANEPTNLYASLLLGEATFSWDNVLGATYELRHREVSSSQWTTTPVTNESITISNLSAGQHVAQVRSICSDGTFSNWVTFDNPPSFVLSSIDHKIDKEILFYQKDKFLYIDSGKVIINKVEIYDVLGKKIYSSKYNNHINLDFINDRNIFFIKVYLDNYSPVFKKIFLSNL